MKLTALIVGTIIILSCASQKSSYSSLSQGRAIWEDQQTSDSVHQDDVVGTWSMSVKTPHGNRTHELTISLEGDQYNGKTNKDNFLITRKGDQLSWTGTVDSPMGSMQAKYLMIVKGAEMTGTIQASGRTLNVQGRKK